MKQNYKDVLGIILDIGRELLRSGAEINRTEDTIKRLALSFGAEKADVFVIYNSISATLCFNGEEYTSTRGFPASTSTDFLKLEKLNGLSRRCAKENMSVQELKNAFEEIRSEKGSYLKFAAGGALAAGSFALFFGGSLWDALTAAVFGVIIILFQKYFSAILPNKMLYTFVSALVSGIGIILISKLVSVLNADKVIIGAIMLLVPGKGITNSARDILLGDTVSGAMKLLESLFLAGALAAGYLIALSI